MHIVWCQCNGKPLILGWKFPQPHNRKPLVSAQSCSSSRRALAARPVMLSLFLYVAPHLIHSFIHLCGHHWRIRYPHTWGVPHNLHLFRHHHRRRSPVAQKCIVAKKEGFENVFVEKSFSFEREFPSPFVADWMLQQQQQQRNGKLPLSSVERRTSEVQTNSRNLLRLAQLVGFGLRSSSWWRRCGLFRTVVCQTTIFFGKLSRQSVPEEVCHSNQEPKATTDWLVWSI